MKSPHREGAEVALPHRSESASFMEQGTSKGDSPNFPKSKSLTLMSPSTEEMSDYEQKENVPQTQAEKSIHDSPIRVNGTGTPKEPLTPKTVNGEIIPQATSTPAANGISYTEQLNINTDSDQDQTDQSDDEALTPVSQDYYEKKSIDYGKFYNTSYLGEGKSNYLKKAPMNPRQDHKSPHFHRPVNFSYSREKPEFLKPKKSGMAALATGTQVVVKRTRRASSSSELRNEEAVRMSVFPAAKPPQPNEITKIEREDWPGPPCPAAILPEILRQRRKSRGETDDEDEEMPPEDPKITKEIEELSKFKDQSGIGKIIYKELEEKRAQPVKALDPWKASRVPSADHEPRYSTRYQSPMFASPSRFLDRPRRYWDDSDISRGYRTMATQYPVQRSSYALTPRAATLPVSGTFGGHLSYRYYDFEDLGVRSHPAATSSSTVNTEQESFTTSSILGGQGISIISLQRSTWHTEAEPAVYSYEKLKISNFDLPKDVDRNMLEIHLSPDDFNQIFKMDREHFKRLAEWKRNDLKRKADLF
ncbi:dematin-like isoform X2 [Ostrea edulis]|nr:dematin-like isoform X2 [Ostrea edulis]